MDHSLLSNRGIGYCLNSSREARSVRQRTWLDSLKRECQEDATKWQNKCGSMLRRIRRIREAVDKDTVVEALSPTTRENRMQTAIEEFSIQTGLDYEESKNVLEHGERGGTLSEPELRLRQLVNQSTVPVLEETVSRISDPAFEQDEIMANDRLYLQFKVWIFSRSFWLVMVGVFANFFWNSGSILSAVPLVLAVTVGLSSYPFPPHSLWRFIGILAIFSIFAKILFQSKYVCEDTSSEVFKIFHFASEFTKSGEPKCPPVYVDSRASRLGLFKLDDWETTSVLSLIGGELIVLVFTMIHLRSLFLSGRLGLTPERAITLLGGDSKPTKDTYTFRFLLSLCVTVLLITDWTKLSASKPIVSSSFLGEGISRNFFSPAQVLAVTLFVFQIVLDRCMYTLMSHSPGDPVQSSARSHLSRKVTIASITVQILILVIFMNLRVVVGFFSIYVLFLSLSARQLAFDIRPVGGKSGFLWTKGYLSYYTYRLYLLIPFLDELRVICDWVASPFTSLNLFMWFKVEDCIQNLRFVQAEMDSRETLPFARGDRACLGISSIVGLVAVITGPLVFFSGLNVLREPNPVIRFLPGYPPTSLTVYLSTQAGLRIPLYASTQTNITSIEPDSVKNDQILAPLMAMRSGDLQSLSFPPASDQEFRLSPPLHEELISSVKKKGNATLTAEWIFDRSYSPFPTTLVRSVEIPAEEIHAVMSNKTGGLLRAPDLLPIAAYLDSTPTARVIEEKGYLKKTELELVKSKTSWWNLKNSKIMVLGERTFGPPTASGTNGYSFSVIGLYIGVVLTVGRFLRLALQGSSKRIAVEELPDTETLMNLCQGIHIARLFKDANTEKKLYYDLVRVFRDPHLLIAATGSTAPPLPQ